MVAVCGIGSPSRGQNKATTAHQSASPQIAATSAKGGHKAERRMPDLYGAGDDE
jgi:hypothetical protein